MFDDGPEYLARTRTPFPPTATATSDDERDNDDTTLFEEPDINALRDALPPGVFTRSTPRALVGIAPVVLCSVLLFVGALRLEASRFGSSSSSGGGVIRCQWCLWIACWMAQGVCWAGLWTVGHEADHNNLSPHPLLNHALGYACHTWLFLPYLSWRITHLRHHAHTNALERDEVYVPATRAERGVPARPPSPSPRPRPLHYVPEVAEGGRRPVVGTRRDAKDGELGGADRGRADDQDQNQDRDCERERERAKARHRELVKEALAEAPLVTCARFLGMQLLGMYIYLTFNSTGSKRYPPGANHWLPSSGLFPTRAQQAAAWLSNFGILLLASALFVWARAAGVGAVVRAYVAPLLVANHWIVTMTFLQHSDPTVPFYRGDAWTKTRGALATVDRPMLGWVGKVFFLGLNHYHTTHHLFATVRPSSLFNRFYIKNGHLQIPFYNLPTAHAALVPRLGALHNYDSTGTARALFRAWRDCVYVEDDDDDENDGGGGILFYRNRSGDAQRRVAKTAN